MSNSTKTILIFLIVVLILLGVWYLVSGKTSAPVPNPTVTQNTTATTPTQPATPSAGVSARDNSDTSLTADLNSIDLQLQTVDTNSASVGQSLNDTPVAQTE